MTQYQGKPVTEVRDIKQGDAGFDANAAKVIVKLENGTEQTVLKNDIK